MTEDNLKSFFETYSVDAMNSDPRVLASHYAEAILAAAPAGSAAFKNDEQFRRWLSQVHALNQQVGIRSLEVVPIDETPIGDHHALPTLEWCARFEITGDEPSCFEISYLLQVSEGKELIIASISHEDQEAVMKARGII